MDDMDDAGTEDDTTLMVYLGTGAGDEGEEEIEVETYEPGEEFTILRGTRAWVGKDITILDESPPGRGDTERTAEEEEEGVLARGRYRWTGAALVYLGRQKGPARPNR